MIASPQNVKKLNDGNKVLVISSLDNTYNAYYIGSTMFNYAEKSINTDYWKINEYVESEVSKLINNTRFSAVHTEETKELPKYSKNSWTLGLDFKGTESWIKEIALSVGANTILFIYPVHGIDPFYNTNKEILGYGYYKRSTLFFEKSINYAYVAATLYDADTLKVITTRASRKSTPARHTSTTQDLSEINSNSVFQDMHIVKPLLISNLRDLLEKINIIESSELETSELD